MDQTLAKALRKAYEYVKAGNKEAARPIIVELLKRDSEIEQAWLLLSVVVDDQKRQIYALNQVLRINPENDKARARLEKMTGKSVSKPVAKVEEPMKAPAVVEPKPAKEELQPASSEADLLNQRLFGGDGDSFDDGGGFSDDGADSDANVEASYSDANNFDFFQGGKSGDSVASQDGEKKKRAWLRPLLLGLLIIIFVGGSYYLYSQGLFGGGTPVTESTAENADMEGSEDVVTEEPTVTPTETEIPATMTSTIAASPTQMLTATATVIPTATSATVVLSESVEDSVLTLQSQIAEIRGIEFSEELKAPVVITQLRAEEIVRSQRKALVIQDSADQHLYEVLGLMRVDQDLENYYLNLLMDPLGGMYIPESDEIYMIGLGFGARESYVYAQQYVHYLMDQEHDFIGLGYDPDCIWTQQQCAAIRAFVEGDAFYSHNVWLETYATADDVATIASLPTNYRMITNGDIPSFALADLAFYYEQGSAFVEALVASEGMEFLAEVYLAPPLTTEQIMHPEKYLDAEEPLFVADDSLSDVLDDAWEEEMTGSLGEWMTSLVLSHSLYLQAKLDRLDALDAAAGWGGDLYQLYNNTETDESLLAIHWVWDNVAEAEEFYSFLSLYTGARFVDGFPEWTVDAICFGNSMIACVAQIDENVYWVVGENLEAIEVVMQTYLDSAAIIE